MSTETATSRVKGWLKGLTGGKKRADVRKTPKAPKKKGSK
jgi:hypothetical protein